MHLQQRLVSTLLVTTMMLGLSPLPFVASPAEASETIHHIVLSSSQSSDGTWSHGGLNTPTPPFYINETYSLLWKAPAYQQVLFQCGEFTI